MAYKMMLMNIPYVTQLPLLRLYNSKENLGQESFPQQFSHGNVACVSILERLLLTTAKGREKTSIGRGRNEANHLLGSN